MFPGIDIILIAQKSDATNYSPLISGIIGLFGVFLGYWLREKNENDQEEFSALLTTKELLDANPINPGEIDKFYKNLRFDLRARKLSTYDIMAGALLKAKEQDNYSIEKGKITTRLNALNKKGLASRTISRINKFFSR